MFMTSDSSDSGVSQPDYYAADQIALGGSGAPPASPPTDNASYPAAPTGSAAANAAPTTAPQDSTQPSQTSAQDAVFAGMADDPLGDPLSGDPLGASTPQPTGPSMAGPSGPSGGGSTNGPVYAASSGPSGPTYTSGPSGPTYTSGPSGPTSTSGTSGPSGPTGPPTWVNGQPTFTFTPPFAPSIGAIAAQTNAEGDSVSLQVNATDANLLDPPFNYHATLTYDAVGLPSGLSINHSTGLISGNIGYDAAEAFGGAYTPTVVVANSLGQSSSVSFAWKITDVVRPPTFTTPTSNQTSNIGDTVSLQVNATQPDNDQLIYDDAGTLPSGLTIDSLSGVISGAVADDAASSYNVTLTATDNTPLDDTPVGNPVVASESFVWTIGVLHDPSLAAQSSQVNAAGDAVSVQLSGTAAPGNTLTYGATNLPDGLGIDPGSGIISGTIQNDAAQNTPYDVTATVGDGFQTASANFEWMVNAVGVANPGDQGNTAGDMVSLPITGTDAAQVALTYSASGLPQGLSIDPTSGVIAGTIALTAGGRSALRRDGLGQRRPKQRQHEFRLGRGAVDAARPHRRGRRHRLLPDARAVPRQFPVVHRREPAQRREHRPRHRRHQRRHRRRRFRGRAVYGHGDDHLRGRRL